MKILKIFKKIELVSSIQPELQFNPFVPNAPFLYSLKTSQTVRFSDAFRGYRKSALGTNGLEYSSFFVLTEEFSENKFFFRFFEVL